jgi:transcriptional regulator with XRE-family HTH domain
MLDLISVGVQIARERKKLKLGQADLSLKAGVSRATLDALENGRVRELGFTKLAKLLAVVGLELKLQTMSSARPTLDELLQENQENRDDQSLDRRR